MSVVLGLSRPCARYPLPLPAGPSTRELVLSELPSLVLVCGTSESYILGELGFLLLPQTGKERGSFLSPWL